MFRKILISFIAVITITCFTTVSVFAIDGVYPLSHFVTKNREINIVIPSSTDDFAFLSSYLDNPSKYYVFSSTASFGYTDKANSPISDYVFDNTTTKLTLCIIDKSDIDKTNSATNVFGTGYSYYVTDHSYSSVPIKRLFFEVTVSPNSDYFTSVTARYSNNGSWMGHFDACFTSSGASNSAYSLISTDKVKLIFHSKEYVPPKPPDPPDPPKPPNPEFTPWYPSDGLTFLERHIKLTTGNVVTVSIGIFAIILAVLIAIRVVKIFSNPS